MLRTKLPTKLKGKREQREQARMQEQIKNPEKLKLLVLSGSKLSSNDFTFMLRCRSLIKLDLSDNQLTKLPQFFKLSQFTQLRLIYLHKNNFKHLEDIRPVLQCPRLIHVTLHDNPIYSNQLQHFLINILKMLKMVNQRVVFEEERMESVVTNKNHVKINIEKLGTTGWGEEGEGAQTNRYIEGLDKQIEQIDRLWVNFNPLVKFQRAWRDRRIDKRTRRVINSEKQIKKVEVVETNEQITLLTKYFSLWKTYKAGRKGVLQTLTQQNKGHLIYDQQQYLTFQRNKRINHIVKSFLKRIREKVKKRKAVKVFQKHLSMKVLIFESADSCFYSISQIDKTHRIIVATYQQTLLEGILENVDIMTGKHRSWTIRPCRDYISIRTVDSIKSEDLTKHNMYRMFLQPSMSCIFLKRKSQFLKKCSLVGIKQLPYIVKSNTLLTQKELKKIKHVTNQITRYTQNQYENSLLQFQCRDPQYFKIFLRLVYYHNCQCLTLNLKKPDLPSGLNFLNPFSNQLIFYFDKQLKRTTSAITIQNTWRRYWTSKASSEIMAEIKRNRAATLIQHFYRGLEFKHRNSFNIQILKHLQEFNELQMLVHQEVYFSICNLPVLKSLCQDLSLWYNKDTVMIKSKFKKSPFNPIVLRQFYQSEDKEDWAQADNYHLLHVGAQVARVIVYGKKYLMFQYKNMEEAKKRAAYLALVSYQYKQKGVFIKGFTRKMLPQIDLLKYIQMIHRMYSIKIQKHQQTDRGISIKNPAPYFLFSSKKIAYYQSSQQPKNSNFEISLRMYHYLDFDEQPEKKDEKIIISLRYFKNPASKEELLMFEQVQGLKLNQSSVLSGCRTNQKLKRLNNTLKNLTAANHSPLQVTKNYQQSHHQKKQKDYLQKKRNEVQLARENSKNSKLITTQYRKIQLGKVKKWVQNQKSAIENSRAQKQEQEEERRQKIRSASESVRDRRNSLQQKNQHEIEFVQKGNFLFKQYLKMAIMKEKKNDIEKKRSSISKKADRKVTQSEEKRGYSILDRSVSLREEKPYSFRNRLDSPLFKSHRSERQSPQEAQKEEQKEKEKLQQLSKTEMLITKPRVKKTKEHMVHGVFPEQFYAIEKKSLNLPKI